MNWLLFWYLITGYVMAFVACNMAELKGKPFGIVETGLVILVNTFFWLPFHVISSYIQAVLIITAKLMEKKLEEK